MPTFNVLIKIICRIKTNNLFKITNISLLFRSFINLKNLPIKVVKRREILLILNKLCVYIYYMYIIIKRFICINTY